MCLSDKKTGSVEVFEIVEIGFDDDITEVKDENGEYDRFANKCVSGLFMIDYEKDYLYIPGVSEAECKKICQEILRTGFCDLSRYGEYEVYGADENEKES